jgi:hypothetical protein
MTSPTTQSFPGLKATRRTPDAARRRTSLATGGLASLASPCFSSPADHHVHARASAGHSPPSCSHLLRLRFILRLRFRTPLPRSGSRRRVPRTPRPRHAARRRLKTDGRFRQRVSRVRLRPGPSRQAPIGGRRGAGPSRASARQGHTGAWPELRARMGHGACARGRGTGGSAPVARWRRPCKAPGPCVRSGR